MSSDPSSNPRKRARQDNENDEPWKVLDKKPVDPTIFNQVMYDNIFKFPVTFYFEKVKEEVESNNQEATEMFMELTRAFSNAANAFYENRYEAAQLLQVAQQKEKVYKQLQDPERVMDKWSQPSNTQTILDYQQNIQSNLRRLKQKSIAEQAIFRELVLQLEERNQEKQNPIDIPAVQNDIEEVAEEQEQAIEAINEDLIKFVAFVTEQLQTFDVDVNIPIQTYFTENTNLLEMVKGKDAERYYLDNIYRELQITTNPIENEDEKVEAIAVALHGKLGKVQNELDQLPEQEDDLLLTSAREMLENRLELLEMLQFRNNEENTRQQLLDDIAKFKKVKRT